MPFASWSRFAVAACFIAMLCVFRCTNTFAQTPAAAAIPPADDERFYLRDHCTKYEYKIPMRDGVKLFASVYVPKDDSQTYPILLMRTPYGCKPYGEDVYQQTNPSLLRFAKEGFIWCKSDVRGRYASEGTFVQMRPIKEHKGPNDTDESTDAYDTIDWLVRHVPRNNGRVGMVGISYPGFYAAAGMIDSHPALRCCSPQAPITDWFVGDDFHHNGAFYMPHAFNWLSAFGQRLEEPTRELPKPFDYKTPDGYEFYLKLGPISNIDKQLFKGKIEFWDELMSHGTYDKFWQDRDLRPHLKNVKTAVMTVGGWYDAEDLFGALHVYSEVERHNPGANNMLVMGPWAHGGWSGETGERLGLVEFHAKTTQFYRDNIEIPFLNHYLKGDKKPDLPKAYVYETGANQWRRFDAWPPTGAKTKTLYFHEGGKLSFDPPKPAQAKDAGYDEYVSDPSKPVPFIPNVAIAMTREHMTDDQRFAASRPDVLIYQTEPLEEDVTLAGPISPKLRVSTTGTDSDFVVKLIDVYSGDFPNPEPNPAGVQMGGYQQLVRGEVFRGKFRNSYEKPEPFKPGEIAKIDYTMPDVLHTFRRGHRIMVQVQSSWFPMVDRNPQTFCDIYHAKPGDFHAATQRVYRTADDCSRVDVQVIATK